MEKRKVIDVLKLTQLGVLSAIIFIMTFTPLGLLKVGPISITFWMIPVAIGAILTGPKGGMFLGFIFGLASFLTCFGYDAFGALVLGINPFFTVIMTIVPRTMMGFLVGIIYRELSKIDKTKTVSFAVSAMFAALLNTILFVMFMIILFGSNAEFLALFGETVVWKIIPILITTNALIEAGVSLLVGGGIAKALSVYLPKTNQTKPAVATKTNDSNKDTTN